MLRKRMIKIQPIIGPGDTKPVFDYKNPDTLGRFMTERGDILTRERSGLSAKGQRELAKQVKRARHLALLPFVTML
ncbi:MAG: 30S ribosomal protein S18 [Patescibacteria group bacterium]